MTEESKVTLDGLGATETLTDTSLLLVRKGQEDFKIEASDLEAFINSNQMETAPFGAAGLKIIKGEELQEFYGFCSIAAFPSGKWVLIYRKSTEHGITDNSEVRAADSYDKGQTWVNDRQVYQNATSDARPDAIKIMANNRAGFFVNRQDEGAVHFSPLFIYTDDEGVNFTTTTVTTSSPYTFQGNGGIIEYPASQGGDGTNGFITFGFTDAGGIDALATTSNGDPGTWSTISNVADGDGVLIQAGGISEIFQIRVGSQDKWIFFCRSRNTSGEWNANLMCFTTNDLTSWGTPTDSGIAQNGNPPAAFYDSTTGNVYYFLVARDGREAPNFPTDSLLMATANASDLYDAGGDFSSLSIDYEVFARLPHWPTGYMVPFYSDGKWYAVLTVGESGDAEAVASTICLLGDFNPSGADESKYNNLLVRRQSGVREINMQASTNDVTNFPLYIENSAGTANAQLGAYGISLNGAGSEFTVYGNVDIIFDLSESLKILAKDNVTTTAAIELYNSAESANAKLGAYGATFTQSYFFDMAAGQTAVFNEAGVDANFRVESSVNANAFFLDGTQGYIGLGLSSPVEYIHARDTSNTVFDTTNASNNVSDGVCIRLENLSTTVGSFCGIFLANRGSGAAIGGIFAVHQGANDQDFHYAAEGGDHKFYSGSNGGTLKFTIASDGSVTTTGDLNIPASDIITDTTTGTKIATGATQKLGFWGATPAVQQAAIADASGGATVDTEARAALNDLLAKLRTLGIIAT